jgi:hypothetical protein
MAITSGLQHLHENYAEIWEWIPYVILERYKELELLLKQPKNIRRLEKTDPIPLIPYIGTTISQLTFS